MILLIVDTSLLKDTTPILAEVKTKAAYGPDRVTHKATRMHETQYPYDFPSPYWQESLPKPHTSLDRST